MEKLIRDGKVAVLYSPGYGAGWYSWNAKYAACIFDPDVAKIILGESEGNVEKIVKAKYGEDFYFGSSLQNLTVEWLPVGTRFYIDEYDGFESIRTTDDLSFTA
jgi:hypothetical protein